MRRRHDTPNGLMEFLVVKAVGLDAGYGAAKNTPGLLGVE